ncbi:MAG: response regulator [Blastocatellia bacterium]|nr:response regulator [Blastocatellia bacterium]
MEVINSGNDGQPSRRLKALIIEGDPSVARLFAEVFAYHDWDVETCNDSLCAEEAISGDGHYDIILISYVIPGTNGIELAKLIRSLDHRRHASIMMVTGTIGIDEEALEAGVDEILHKPLDIQSLLSAAQKCLLRCLDRDDLP